MTTPHEERIGQRDGFNGGFIKVRVDEVRLPSGRESLREVVEHPGAVAIVAVTAEKRLLLVRQYRYPAGQDLLEIPAGTREPGEDPAITAARELREETGYEPGSITEVLRFYSSPGYSTEQIILFYATDCRPVAHERNADEPANLETIALSDLADLLSTRSGTITDGKTLVGLLWLSQEIAP